MDVNTQCPRCAAPRASIVRDGFYHRADDSKCVQRMKCKPLTVPVAVVDGMRIPLGFRVASIPAFGHLAAISRKRYGKRIDRSRIERRHLFEQLRDVLPPDVEFKTDGHEHYATLIRQYFPDSEHQVYQSARGAVVGQGELNKTVYDHLFSVNHTFASIRSKVNRLNRRTWCTTKDPERLADHIDIFIDVFCDRLKILAMPVRTLRDRAAQSMVLS